jgi:MFS family permease
MDPGQHRYHRQRLFVASCIALVTTAMAFSIRTDILKEWGVAFNISHEQQGLVNLMGIWGFPIAILLVGLLCNVLGMGLLLRLACLGHILGTLLTILSPQYGFPMLLASTLLIGLSNGTVEAVINPLIATMYPEEKTHKLNVLHAWWPGGLVIGGLLAYALGELGFGWQVKMSTIIVAAIIYGVMILRQPFPPTERAEAGVPMREMFKEILRPFYLLLLLCMCMTAITELGPDQWVGSVLTDTVGIRGVLFLVYTAGLMFVLRQFFAGVLAGAFLHAAGSDGDLCPLRLHRTALAQLCLYSHLGAAGSHPVRHRQDLLLADHAGHHFGAVPAWWRVSACLDGRNGHDCRRLCRTGDGRHLRPLHHRQSAARAVAAGGGGRQV